MTDQIKRNWSFAETKALILAYRNRQEEYATTMKKKHFWESVLTDLESMDILERLTTVEQIEIKWRSLWRSYKAAKDRGTGRCASRFLFLDLMDDMFGSRPTIASSHSRSVGVVSGMIEPVHPSQLVEVSHSEEETSSSTNDQSSTSPAPKRKRKSNSEKLAEIKIKYYEHKIQESKEKTKLLETYLKNKEAARKEHHI